jgi:hypothetical protein
MSSLQRLFDQLDRYIARRIEARRTPGSGYYRFFVP